MTTVALDRSVVFGVRSADRPAWHWVATLYFAEGLPATVVLTLSAIILKQIGLSNGGIATCVSTFMLPWILRPLWSPLLELVSTKRRFVIGTEVVIAFALAGIGIALPSAGAVPICLGLFAVLALCAATHDMAADGLFIRSLPAETQKKYVGWLGVAYNAAKLVTQGLIVVMVGGLAPWQGALLSWQVAFLLLATVTAGLALHHAHTLPADAAPCGPRTRTPREIASSTGEVVTTFFAKGIGPLLAFIVLYRLAEGQVARMVPLFLLESKEKGGLGLTTVEFGALYGGIGGVMFVSGAVAGGWLAARLGEQRAMLPLCLAFNAPALIYLVLARMEPSVGLVAIAIVADQLAYGIGSIGLKLATLSAARGPYETAHCAFAGGLSGIGAVAAGMFSGTLQTSVGYAGFFGLAILAALVPVAVAYCSLSRRVVRIPTVPQ